MKIFSENRFSGKTYFIQLVPGLEVVDGLGPLPLLLVHAVDHVVVLRVPLLALLLQELLRRPLLLVELTVEVGDALLQAQLQDLVVLDGNSIDFQNCPRNRPKIGPNGLERGHVMNRLNVYAG